MTLRKYLSAMVLASSAGCALDLPSRTNERGAGGKADDSQELTLDDHGTTIDVSAGENVVVALPANPTTGYTWRVVVTDRTFGHPIFDEFVPAYPDHFGSPGVQRLTWVTDAAAPMYGPHHVELAYSLADGQPGDDTFAFTVNIVPSGKQKWCGGIAGATCADDEYCAYAPEAMCGMADQTGLCEKRPDYCQEILAPVCGCDGITYDNECAANGAGTSVKHEGVCGPLTERTPVEGFCTKNSDDSCSTDADCVAGGCGGELCYNPAEGGGISTCECYGPALPVIACGCVANQCTWYN